MTKRLRFAASMALSAVVLWMPLAQAAPGTPASESRQDSTEQVLQALRADSAAASARDSQRLAELLDDREALDAALAEARESLAAASERREALEARQAEQQQRLAELSQRRDSEVGDLDGVYDVVRRHVGELRDALGESWLTVGGGARLPQRLDEQGLLDVATLQALNESLVALTVQSGRGVRFTAPVADSEGKVAPREVIRLGALSAFSEGQLLRQPDGEGPLAVAERTPTSVTEKLLAFQQGEGDVIALDPTQGEILAALAQQPSLWQRFQQGGAVGYVIVALGVAGLLVALAQYVYLLVVSLRLRRQLREPETLRDDNPLGRVLTRFDALGEGHAPEALEARLDEAILAEQPRIERGQPIVKLIAAIAPLLGLLGTVTGMIVTFQSITTFGTGDPKLMAGGISQALVTTVLGLITAVPLLFANTALSSRSRELVGVLEGRASAMLADHLESRRAAPESRRHAAPA
ncbi:biopolymer transport protein ExbB [Modicisalibacter muralis]|uniref:Biopolymer transport protein ExbB n=2 Tax=Modicisalibacter muralis TaxID=119000 RepID=A0A1G9MAM4_9GAMM|nr:biopolymer transport protein ExbB [Halomonas muralis]